MGVYFTYLRKPIAEKYIRKAIKLAQKINNEYYIRRSKFELFTFFLILNRLDDAEKLALELLPMMHGKSKGDNISLLNNLGAIYQRQGKYLQAIKYFKKTRRMAYKIKSPHYIQSCLSKEAIVYFHKKEYSKTIEIFKKLLSEFSKDDYFMKQLIWLKNLGVCYVSIGKFKEAINNYNDYIKLSKKCNQVDRILEGYIYKSLVHFRQRTRRRIQTDSKHIIPVLNELKVSRKTKEGYKNLFQLMQELIKYPKTSEQLLKIYKNIPNITKELAHYHQIIKDILKENK